MFFFNDTATTEIYTLSLHDALPISQERSRASQERSRAPQGEAPAAQEQTRAARALQEEAPAAQEQSRASRSEEHTSELQSRQYLVCRLLLEKKNPYVNHFEALRVLF